MSRKGRDACELSECERKELERVVREVGLLIRQHATSPRDSEMLTRLLFAIARTIVNSSLRMDQAKGEMLTDIQFSVAKLASRGATNQEIANRTRRGVGTIKSHLSRAFQKLGVKNRAELLAALVAKHPELIIGIFEGEHGQKGATGVCRRTPRDS